MSKTLPPRVSLLHEDVAQLSSTPVTCVPGDARQIGVSQEQRLSDRIASSTLLLVQKHQLNQLVVDARFAPKRFELPFRRFLDCTQSETVTVSDC